MYGEPVWLRFEGWLRLRVGKCEGAIGVEGAIGGWEGAIVRVVRERWGSCFSERLCIGVGVGGAKSRCIGFWGGCGVDLGSAWSSL